MRNRIEGRIGELLVGWVLEDKSSDADKWHVVMFLQPQPSNLDDMTDNPKVSVESAKRTAQRIVNEYVAILSGEKKE